MMICQINDDWALSADHLQWILQRRRTGAGGWRDMAFVSSTRQILARVMKEKGVPSIDAELVLRRLPNTFEQWKESHSGPVSGDRVIVPLPTPLPEARIALTTLSSLAA
jgi:hypothetical protein